MAGKNPFRSALIAPLGMDCAICMAHLREKNHCSGCYAPDRKCSRECTISSANRFRTLLPYLRQFPVPKAEAAGQEVPDTVRK
jgi:hypothetical protein